MLPSPELAVQTNHFVPGGEITNIVCKQILQKNV